jgi:hypothetical protein
MVFFHVLHTSVEQRLELRGIGRQGVVFEQVVKQLRRSLAAFAFEFVQNRLDAQIERM